MPEQLFQLIDRNLPARRVSADGLKETADWCGGEKMIDCVYIGSADVFAEIGDWIVQVIPPEDQNDIYSTRGIFIVVKDETFRRHFTPPRVPWTPPHPMPHWYREPSPLDGKPLYVESIVIPKEPKP